MSCKSGGNWVRPSGDVSNSINAMAECAEKCKDYKYFGLECPRATVHCQCTDSLEGSTKLDDSECLTGRGHCEGPYEHGGYMMGGYGTGSVYLVEGASTAASHGSDMHDDYDLFVHNMSNDDTWTYQLFDQNDHYDDDWSMDNSLWNADDYTNGNNATVAVDVDLLTQSAVPAFFNWKDNTWSSPFALYKNHEENPLCTWRPQYKWENGFCVTASGGDQNSGVTKINGLDGNTIAAQAHCYQKCLATPGATGCEVIWDQNNRGCYVHTKEAARGNNAARHMCSIFKTYTKKYNNNWDIGFCLKPNGEDQNDG